MTNTWLQAVVPVEEWQTINKRRQALGLTWAQIILPGTLLQLDKLEQANKKKAKKKTPDKNQEPREKENLSVEVKA